MLKLLIVDDDEIICAGIAACIEWKKHGVEVVGTAYDGEIGLEMARELHPDVMLVDINMPFMDGLELTYEVYQFAPHIKTILLTAYKEFEYAKRAIELKVFKYLSKPFSNEEILQAVLDAGSALLAENSYRHEIEENKEIIRQKYLSQIVTGQTQRPQKIRWCGLNSHGTSYAVGILVVSYLYPEAENDNLNEALLTGEYSQMLFLDNVKAVLSGWPEVTCFPDGEWVLLLFSGLDAENVKKTAEEILHSLRHHYGYHISLGLGRCYSGAAQIHYSYKEAKSALEYRHYYGSSCVIPIETIETRSGDERINFAMYRKQILDLVRVGDVDGAQKAAALVFETIQQARCYNLMTITLLSVELLMAAFRATGDEIIYERFVEEGLPEFHELHKAKNIGEIQRAVHRGLNFLVEIRGNEERGDLVDLMERVTAYIDENFADPDLSLKTVASHVHISTSYLCILFRQIKQTSYINYLNQTRIEKAKQLLKNSRFKTYEVAFEVGYNSSQYFASSFKKYTGNTPSEFRNMMRKSSS